MVKANPGGSIDPQFIFGRDNLIRQIWDILDRQCVLLNAERRIGKTSIVRKMAAAPPDGWLAIFQNLDKIHTPQEFSEAVYKQVQQYLGWVERLKSKILKAAEDHNTGEVGLNARTWKELLEDTIKQLMAAQKSSGKRLVMLWEEVPYMINNIRKRDGEQAAVEVLDQLRSLCQENPELRMVFTGSVGLHHVLDSIQKAQISAAPVNDMYAMEVTPLAQLDHFAECELPVSIADLLAAVQMQAITVTRDDLIRILRLMERDHYLQRNEAGLYQFRFELIKRWWKLDRGL